MRIHSRRQDDQQIQNNKWKCYEWHECIELVHAFHCQAQDDCQKIQAKHNLFFLTKLNEEILRYLTWIELTWKSLIGE